MKRIRYSKYVPDPAGEMSMEDLLSALSDYLLQSGFQDSMWYELPQDEQTVLDGNILRIERLTDRNSSSDVHGRGCLILPGFVSSIPSIDTEQCCSNESAS